MIPDARSIHRLLRLLATRRDPARPARPADPPVRRSRPDTGQAVQGRRLRLRVLGRPGLLRRRMILAGRQRGDRIAPVPTGTRRGGRARPLRRSRPSADRDRLRRRARARPVGATRASTPIARGSRQPARPGPAMQHRPTLCVLPALLRGSALDAAEESRRGRRAEHCVRAGVDLTRSQWRPTPEPVRATHHPLTTVSSRERIRLDASVGLICAVCRRPRAAHSAWAASSWTRVRR